MFNINKTKINTKINTKITNIININQFNRYMKHKKKQIIINNYNPNINNKKYLVIMACHCDSDIKLNAISRNLKYFSFENIYKIIINTKDLPYSTQVANICAKYANTTYREIPNSSYYDYGKWINVLNKENENVTINYDYIIFTNDSFIIHNSITHFLNLIHKENVQLYGYNDSTQTRYHYQSYLFALRKDALPIFINKVNDTKLTISSQLDVINNFETQMTTWFSSHKCFLNIGNFILNKNKNIFFTNDLLYLPLKRSLLLPFTKIKSLL